jgi:hypothetical protein
LSTTPYNVTLLCAEAALDSAAPAIGRQERTNARDRARFEAFMAAGLRIE